MNVYMVLAFLGTGGKAAAVTARASMFARAGYQVTIIVMNYQPNMTERVAQKRSEGKLDPDVKVLNLFDELSATADRTGSRFRLSQLRRSRRKTKPPRLHKILEQSPDLVLDRDNRGTVTRAMRYDDGKLAECLYFSQRGFLYARRNYDQGNSKSVDAVGPSTGEFKNFGGYLRWQVKWLAHLVQRTNGHSVILCDSQAKMSAILSNPDLAIATRVAVLHSNHFSEYPYSLGSVVKADNHSFLERLNELDALVVLTQAQRNDIAAQYGNADKIHVIPNFIQDRGAVEDSGCKYRVSIVSRLSKEKRIGDAVKAFATVVHALPQAKLDIYGRGDQQRKLQVLIEKHGLGDAVRLHGYTNNAHEEMASSNLTMLPTNTEALPMTIAESMLACTPVVAYDVNYGPADLIDDGRDGTLVPHGDIDALASSIIDLLRDPDRARHMGMQGREKIRSTMNSRTVVQQWNELLMSLHQES